MHSKKLRWQLLVTDTSNVDEKYNIWATLDHCLDKTCIMILKSESKETSQKQGGSWRHTHFCSSETPCVTELLEQLTCCCWGQVRRWRITWSGLNVFIFIGSSGRKDFRKVVKFLLFLWVCLINMSILKRCSIFPKPSLCCLIWKRNSENWRTRKNKKNVETRLWLSLMQRCLFRKKMLRNFLLNVSAATSADIWQFLSG